MAFYDQLWRWKQGTTLSTGIMKDLHPLLKLELRIYLYKELLNGIPMFARVTDMACFIEIIDRLKQRLSLPGEILMDEGEVGDCMYLVVNGVAEVLVRKEKTSYVRYALPVGGWVVTCTSDGWAGGSVACAVWFPEEGGSCSVGCGLGCRVHLGDWVRCSIGT